MLTIYTDGSHFKHSSIDHIGAGAYCLHNGVEYEFSKPITEEIMKKYGIVGCKISNPTAEFIAFAEVLDYFLGSNYSEDIVFKIDYIGVEAWMNNKWQAREAHIIKVRDHCKATLAKIKARVRIEYIASKSDSGNLKADALAKSLLYKDTFSLLMNEI